MKGRGILFFVTDKQTMRKKLRYTIYQELYTKIENKSYLYKWFMILIIIILLADCQSDKSNNDYT